MINRSVSEPSVGTSTILTNATSRASHGNLLTNPNKGDKPRGGFLWEGRIGRITRIILLAPWTVWFQAIILLATIYMFLVHFLVAYYLEKPHMFLEVSLILCEVIFSTNIFVDILHAFWPIVRLHMRVHRRNILLLLFDVFTLFPLCLAFKYNEGYERLVLAGRWLGILRIYRIFIFFREINEDMRASRKMLYLLEHMVTTFLILNASTCLWYAIHKTADSTHWYGLGYPSHVNARRLVYKSYNECWYYCACRFFNVIFGDSFPLQYSEKWLTSVLMITGYVFFKYKFIGIIAWEIILNNNRRSNFVDQYHHMVRYLNLRGTPSWLIEQAKLYKKQLWKMKDGVLTSKQLRNLPAPLQMELIFDINVGHFHSTLLFRETGIRSLPNIYLPLDHHNPGLLVVCSQLDPQSGTSYWSSVLKLQYPLSSEEAFMRQISLLMRHELFLTGQHIWSQGVVKSGMICIKRGVIEMLSDEDDESPMIAFKEGTVLGELSLFYSIPSKVTVKAATYVELQVLRRTDFMRVVTEHPNMLEHIRNKIKERLNKSRCRQEAIMKYDKDDSRLIRTRYRPMKVLKDNLAGVEEEDSAFVDDSHMYYKDENNVRQAKFTPEYLELYEMTNNVTTIDAPRICLRSSFPWILEPNTDFTHMFDIAHLIMVIYLCIMSPRFAIQNAQTDLERIFSTIVKTGLILNIYIQLTTAIFDKYDRKVSVKEIAEAKMCSIGFYMDIISVFPIHIFTDTLDPQGESVAGQLAKLFPVLQVWHIWDYIGKWENSFHANLKFLSVVKYTIIFMIFCYWSGCFLYLFACPGKLCRENSWMSLLVYWETKVFMTNDAKHEKPLLSALIFGTSVFTNSGTTEMSPGGNDLLVVAIIFIFGSYLFCFYTAKICSIYVLSTQRKFKFKESMRELFYFLSVNHVSGRIKARVKKFFCVQWYYNNAVSAQEILKDMSANIQQEVLSIEMVDTLLYCQLFQECNRDFLQTVASNARTIVLPDNEIVQHAADIGRDMYILQKGHCKLLNHQGKVVRTIGPGSDFGVVEMLFGLPKVYTIVTSTNCILLYVEYTALVQCWGTFPDISHPIITALADTEVRSKAKQYEDAKPLTGKMDAKINRIAQEIKESFVVLSGREKAHFVKTFERLGVMRHLRYMFLPGCITPYGIFLKLWSSLRFILALYYVLIIPYDISTKRHKFSGGYNYADIILYIDIAVMSYVAYYNHRSLLVTHPLLTVSRYLKHAFFMDVLSVFPFEQLVRVVNESTDLDLYRINRLLLVTRITGAFSYWESDIMRVNPAVVLLKFLPIAMTLINVATALVFVNSCTPYLPVDSHRVMVNCSRVLVVSSFKYETKDALTEYIYTFYWVFEIFVGLGCSPVQVANKVDVWLVMILQLAGFLYFAFMFGYVASTRSTASHALLTHTEKTKDLANFLYQQNVEPTLTAKTLKYFEYVWKRTNGSNPQQICRRLNSSLMEDTLAFMYERALREVPLFGKVERSFIRVITQHLTEMYFLKGDTVIQCRDVQANIFIIYKGKVDVLSSYNEMITCMGPGGMFGNFTGQPISSSEVTIFASRNLDLLVIPSLTFCNLVKYYPKIQDPLNKAFEMSTNYILPITMDVDGDSSSDDTEQDASLDSAFDSKSESSPYDAGGAGALSLRSSQSQSNVSATKSSTSTLTIHSYTHVSNLLRPGTMMFQLFGYITCIMATCNYVVALYEIVTLNDCFVIFWLEAFFDIYFYIKTYLTMHQGYISKHREYIIDTVKCRRRYYKHKIWVWTDLIVNIPLELLAFCFPNPVRIMHYLRANKLFRVKYLVEFYHKTSAELTNDQTALQAAMTVIVVILFIHTFTCVWLLTLMATTPIVFMRTLKMHVIDEDTPQRKWDYTSSFYVVASELTTTGGDEFVIDELFPMIIIAIILVCGKMLAAIVVATAMQVAFSSKYALTCYEEVTGELIDMLKNQGLSNYQLKKFWKYVQQLWVTERGRQLPALLLQTPYVRRCDLMTAMFGSHLRNCYLFSDTGESFLRQLTVSLEYTTFFPGNYIVVAGDSEARMYWIESGTVSVLSVRSDLTETTHELLCAGDVFGILQGLNKGVKHCFSYRAESKVNILTLSQDAWINILPFFPEAKRIITERSELLFSQI